LVFNDELEPPSPTSIALLIRCPSLPTIQQKDHFKAKNFIAELLKIPSTAASLIFKVNKT
jgi:hypothetical protein